VVRITPDELHIDDPTFYHSVFVSSAVRKTENYPRASHGTGFEGEAGLQNLTPCNAKYSNSDMIAVSRTHEMHRSARGALDPLFSKAGVLKMEHRVFERVQKMCARLRMIQGIGKVVNMTDVINSVTTGKVLRE
jgi:hypothetical protein